MIYDNLLREGVIENLIWLIENYAENLLIQIADIREKDILQKSIDQATAVFHFASQVAVTTSIVDPMEDYEVNLSGTMFLLEAVRYYSHQPLVFFTFINIIYVYLHNID